MGEDLLGYLLNAVDDTKRRQIEAALRRDPQLRRELAALRQQLESDEGEHAFRPPPGLVQQTCDLVQGCQQRASDETARRRSNEVGGASRLWSLADALMGTALFVVAATLFFPAIANSRFRSDIRTCEHNLQRLGVAMYDFSDRNHGLFPSIPLSGNRAAAGVYGPILFYGGYFEDKRILVCPSSTLADRILEWSIPTLPNLDRAEGVHLGKLQRDMGGSYGYAMGYQNQWRYFPPRNEGRAFYALMSDAPSLHLPGRRSSNHFGRGQNVLYEDGHIEFVVDQFRSLLRDPLFTNRLGYAEAGADKNDSVIGGSDMPPIRLAFFRQ
ncbi:MAG: hypothetical protein KJ000_16260 [Pirellulaceae bacterium]|nr:hypothetical protein [Pirellulaceae bacterium]